MLKEIAAVCVERIFARRVVFKLGFDLSSRDHHEETAILSSGQVRFHNFALQNVSLHVHERRSM